jgi:hypothetical protein
MPLTKIQSLGITDGTIVNADINASAAIAGTKLSGAGISEADSWRLSANKSADGDLTANLERDDATGFGYIGTGMTQSSGIFTFPSTGVYLINFNGTFLIDTDILVYIEIKTTTDNSSYITRAEGFTNAGTASSHTSATCFCFFDVTSTANCKVKFGVGHMSSGNLLGTSGFNYTSMNFIRLGDT